MDWINIVKAVALGISEGITEFLPVSSTGHLILLNKSLALHTTSAETFEVAIQLGAISAVAVVYAKQIKELWTRHLQVMILATTPILIVGFLAHSWIKNYLFSTQTVAIGLFAGALLMIASQWIASSRTSKDTTQTLEKLTRRQALIIGCFQILALWPGMSRAASAICGGLWANLDYETTTDFAFIIALPVIPLAAGYELAKQAAFLTPIDIQLIGIGIGTSFIVGLATIVLLVKAIKKIKLLPFAIYRIILAAFMI